MIGAPHDIAFTELMTTPIKALLLSAFGKQKAIPFISKASPSDLKFIAELMVNGKLQPVIDKIYPLSEAASAIRHVEQGHARGKVVITLSTDC